jgi:hypothetical protein
MLVAVDSVWSAGRCNMFGHTWDTVGHVAVKAAPVGRSVGRWNWT